MGLVIEVRIRFAIRFRIEFAEKQRVPSISFNRLVYHIINGIQVIMDNSMIIQEV